MSDLATLKSDLAAIGDQLTLRALVQRAQELKRELDVARQIPDSEEEVAISARLARVTKAISERLALSTKETLR